MIYLSSSEKDTLRFGHLLGRAAAAGDILLLTGDLGAGKTVIARGIASGCGAEEYVTSPTYTLMNRYSGRLTVYHFDLYRLAQPEDLYDLDYEEYFYGDGITIVEWPERMGYLYPEEGLEINVRIAEDGNTRIIEIENGARDFEKYREVLKEYESTCG